VSTRHIAAAVVGCGGSARAAALGARGGSARAAALLGARGGSRRALRLGAPLSLARVTRARSLHPRFMG
jgi:hypothetical protein